MTDELKDVDKTVAFVLELVGGIFGILGIGHIYAGEVIKGVVILTLWIAFLTFSWVTISILSIFLIGLCCMPFMILAQFLVPLWSAFHLKNRLEEMYPD